MNKPALPSAVRLALEELKQELSDLYGDRLRRIYLYGSYARGTADEDSDVDVLIALDGEVNSYAEISRIGRAVSEICLRHDVLIATYPVSEAWLAKRKTPLLENVRREGVLL